MLSGILLYPAQRNEKSVNGAVLSDADACMLGRIAGSRAEARRRSMHNRREALYKSGILWYDIDI